MLNRLFEYFDEKIRREPKTENISSSSLLLAATALMLEVARSDEKKEQSELHIIEDILLAKLGEDSEEARDILEAAQDKSEEAHDLYQFTSLINREFSRQEKEHLIRSMWQVAYADGRLDRYEDHIIRRVADLIHIDHSDFIRLKIKSRPD
ncbi:MAG: hypothetical protein CMQ40_03115 [Gammaproteobacteria bacterium]|nr:hypothetical protein [Gammaproteobacteria bacterium]